MKLLTYTALIASVTCSNRWLQDDAVEGSGKQPKGAACTSWKADTTDEGTLWTDLVAADVAAMDDAAKEEWMVANVYDPAGDTCEKGETCVMYYGELDVETYSYALEQSCQICDLANLGSTIEYFDSKAPKEEAAADDSGDAGDDAGDDSGDAEADAGDADADADAEPEEDPKEINTLEDDTTFFCLNAKYMAVSAGALAATMAMLY